MRVPHQEVSPGKPQHVGTLSIVEDVREKVCRRKAQRTSKSMDGGDSRETANSRHKVNIAMPYEWLSSDRIGVTDLPVCGAKSPPY